MVSISFGKSNFSKAQNSYQMTISLIMMVIMMCAVSSLGVPRGYIYPLPQKEENRENQKWTP